MDKLLKDIEGYMAAHPEFARVMRLFNTSAEQYRKAVEAMGTRRETRITASSTTRAESCRLTNR